MVSLQDVVDALEIAADETSSYVNSTTGQVITLTHEDLRLAEEDPVADMPEWERDVVAAAREVLESDDWLELPGKFDVHEWEVMNRFGQSLSTPSQRARVADAIHGSGAFRNFKGTIRRLGVEEAWFAYKRRELEAVARNWLAAHDLEVGAAQPTVADERSPCMRSEPGR